MNAKVLPNRISLPEWNFSRFVVSPRKGRVSASASVEVGKAVTGGEVTGGVVTDVDAMMHRTSLAMPSVINAAAMVVEVTAAATDALKMQEMQDALRMQAMQNVAKMTSDILFALNE